MVHGLSLATITGRWLGETQFMQVRMMWALPCPATVHQRPCMTREMKTWLSDSRVGNNSVVQRRSRRPVLSPLRNCVDGCHVWQYIASRCKPWRWMLKDISICGWDSMIEAYCQYTVTMTTMNTTMTELSGGFTSHSTQNRSFRRRFPKPIYWLGMEKTKPNSTTKAHIHQSKEI